MSSSYYWVLYLDEVDHEKELEGYLKELTGIYNALEGNFTDDVYVLNFNLNDLEMNLTDSVRYSSDFKRNTELLEQENEMDTDSDKELGQGASSICDELDSLNNKIRESQDLQRSYYASYESEKAREEEEARREAERIAAAAAMLDE